MDKKEDKLKLNRFTDQEKVQLFNRFIDGGGHLVKKKFQQLQSGKKILYSVKDKKSQISEPMPTIRATFKDKIIIYFKSLVSNVITFNGALNNRKFFNFLDKKVIPNLKNLHFIVLYLLFSDKEIINEIKESFKDKKPYYEILLKKYVDLFDENEFKELLYVYSKADRNSEKLSNLEEPLIKIFKKIYLLKNYVNGSTNTLRNALLIVSRKQGWDNVMYKIREKQIIYTLSLIFYQLLPKLYSLLLNVIKVNIPLESRRIEPFLNIKESDKIEYQTFHKDDVAGMQLPDIMSEKKEEDDIQYVAKKFFELNDDDFETLGLKGLSKIGMQLIQETNVDKIIFEYQELSELKSIQKNDKVYHIIAYLKEFEKEYLFILSSQKVKYNIVEVNGHSIDYRNKVNALDIPLIHIYDIVYKYVRVIKNLEDISNSGIDEINKSNQMFFLDGERSNLSYNIRQQIMAFFFEIKDYFEDIIEDNDGPGKLISNPDDFLHFDTNIEGYKKMQNNTVMGAIKVGYSFVLALIFRMEEYGDLYGIAVDIQDIKIPYKGTSKKETEKNKSFLDEIDSTLKK